MTTAQSTSRNEDRAWDRDRELERTIRDALFLAEIPGGGLTMTMSLPAGPGTRQVAPLRRGRT
jgi:hypothetical protein